MEQVALILVLPGQTVPGVKITAALREEYRTEPADQVHDMVADLHPGHAEADTENNY